MNINTVTVLRKPFPNIRQIQWWVSKKNLQDHYTCVTKKLNLIWRLDQYRRTRFHFFFMFFFQTGDSLNSYSTLPRSTTYDSNRQQHTIQTDNKDQKLLMKCCFFLSIAGQETSFVPNYTAQGIPFKKTPLLSQFK